MGAVARRGGSSDKAALLALCIAAVGAETDTWPDGAGELVVLLVIANLVPRGE